ncbi:hypothetical protein DIPPA_13404 [Diplonema papillatum]|nr:hypothetical protein DIPPA_13404 [Diplonema papillatum]|eukprot:gene16585-25438_t
MRLDAPVALSFALAGIVLARGAQGAEDEGFGPEEKRERDYCTACAALFKYVDHALQDTRRSVHHRYFTAGLMDEDLCALAVGSTNIRCVELREKLEDQLDAYAESRAVDPLYRRATCEPWCANWPDLMP